MTTAGAFRVCSVSQSSETRGIVKNEAGLPQKIQSGLSANEALNSQSLKDLRRKMMNGEDVSDTCKRCQFEEKNQLPSHRQIELGRFKFFDQSYVNKWTESDGTLKSGSPVSMALLRLGNKCNLTCRMCGPSSSSAWYQEWLETKHPGFKEAGERIVLNKNEMGLLQADPNPYAWTEDGRASEFIAECGNHLERIQFSGGEPLLSAGHLEILKNLVQTERAAQITLEYTSNLTVLPDTILNLWGHFKSVEMGISIDGPPAVNEYIRYPLKSKTLLANLKKLDQARVNGRFWISTTVQIYNVLYLEQLRDWISAQQFEKISADFVWHILRAPQELSIFALPIELKHLVAAKLQDSRHFSKIAEVIFGEDKSAQFPQFLDRTKTMDQYREQRVEQLDELWRVLSAHSINT